uniref:Dorsal esophageal gland-specific protein n=1 Tax=Heterodera avenae TaxID=34510 RepID=F8QV53_HETAV|nr:dorsal esophageal gland-specific protein [Heterodera avenae]
MLTPVLATMKKRRKCSFNPAWEHQYAFVKRSKKGNGYFYCAFCAKDINVQTMGISAVKSHIDNNKHKQMAKNCCHPHQLDDEQKVIVLPNDGGERQEQRRWLNVVQAVKMEHQPHYYAASSSHDMQMTVETTTKTAAQETAENATPCLPQQATKSERDGVIMSDFEDESENEMSLANNDEEEEEDEEEGKEGAPWHGGKHAKYFQQIVKDGIFMAKVRCLICGKELSAKSRTSIREHNKLHQLAAINDESVFDEQRLFPADAAVEAFATAFVEKRKPIVMPLPPMARHRRKPTEMTPQPAFALATRKRCESMEDDNEILNADDHEHNNQPNLSQFDWNKQKVELQILEAELIQKQLSNYQRCTELGIPARVHLPVGTVSATTLCSSTGRCRRFTTFSNEQTLYQRQQHSSEAERQRRHVPLSYNLDTSRENGGGISAGRDDGSHLLNFDGGAAPCDFVAFADI